MISACTKIHRLVFVFLLIGSALHATAQGISGMVTSESDKPLEKVSVVLLTADGDVIAFTTTHKDGSFSMEAPKEETATQLRFNMVGYASQTISLNDFKTGQTVKMAEQAMELDEITVRPEDIIQRGDTLIYSVAAFKKVGDRSIEDVIKRLPGIRVDADGKISYQGKAINHLYVEGMDLMGDKYAMTTRNLNADKVKNVEVLQHHQDVKALRGIKFSDQAALNLVLTDEAKDVWTGTVSAMAGATMQGHTDFLRGGRLVGMMFGRKMQSMSMYKADNSGENIESEVKSKMIHDWNYDSEEHPLQGQSFISRLSGSKQQFNDTHLTATNWLLKTSPDDELRAQLSYLFDHSEQNRYSSIVYKDTENGSLRVEETHDNSYRSELEGELLYSRNADKLHFSNMLSTHFDFNHSNSHSELNGASQFLKATPHKRGVADRLSVTKRMTGGKYLRMQSSLSYNFMPGRTTLFDASTQCIDLESLRWNAKADYSHRLWKLYMSYEMDANIVAQEMYVANTDTAGTQRYREQGLFFKPSVGYKYKAFSADLTLNMNASHKRAGKNSSNQVTVSPSLDLRVKPFRNAETNIHYDRAASTTNDIMQLSTLAFFSNYSNSSVSSGEISKIVRTNLSLNQSLQMPQLKLFMHGAVGFAKFTMPMRAYRMENGIRRTEVTALSGNTPSMFANGSIRKNLDWMHTNIGLSASYHHGESPVLINGKSETGKSRSMNMSLSLGMQPAKWVYFDVRSSMNRSATSNSYSGDRISLTHYSHDADITFSAGKLSASIKNECYHSNDEQEEFRIYSDCHVAYKTKEWEIRASLCNIFGNDKQVYRYVNVYSDVFTITNLRPRELKISFTHGL